MFPGILRNGLFSFIANCVCNLGKYTRQKIAHQESALIKISFKEQPSHQYSIGLVTEDEMKKVIEMYDEHTGGATSKFAKQAGFKAKAGQTFRFDYLEDGETVVLGFYGLGKAPDNRAYEKAGAETYKAYHKHGLKELSVYFPSSANEQAKAYFAHGAELACYQFQSYKTKTKAEAGSLKSLVLQGGKEAKAEHKSLKARSEGVHLARDLVNEPPNALYPASFAKRVEELEEFGVEVTILGEKEMKKLKMHSLLGVGQGSRKESQLAIMKWNGGKAGEKPVALVGKGVCFDTGGISLKPGAKMEDMKGDMGGAAAVTGAIMALAKRKAKANVIGVLGLVENMPDGDAQRPGDIVTAADGQTIEIQNTDAEGRLVLADALWYTQKHLKPKAILDLATLTGAIITSLGHQHAGLFSNNDDLSQSISEAGEISGDKVWRLPLNEAYDKQIDSDFADMRNIGGPSAGSITAAQFLKRFIQDDLPWAYIDIAGMAWKPERSALEPSWGTGFGVRLLDEFINIYEAR